MTTDVRVTGHADDADLLRLLDGAAGGEERAAIEAHLAACGACPRRRDLLRARSARLAELLAAADAPAPAFAMRPGAPRRAAAIAGARWRAAAALALLLGGALAVQPVRAWIVRSAGVLWAAATGKASRPAPVTVVPAPAPRDSAGAVAFVPNDPAFTVRVTGRQAGGTLTIEPGEGPEVIAAIAGGSGPAELLVLPDGLEIGTTASSTRSYRVRVPPGVARITVQVAGTTVRVIRAPFAGPAVLDLQRPR